MRNDIAVRYAQVAQILSDKFLFIEDIMHELRTSENYARKLISDLCFSGHVVQRATPTPRGRSKLQFGWHSGKPAPTVYTRQIKPSSEKIRRTDPLMIALYGEAGCRQTGRAAA